VMVGFGAGLEDGVQARMGDFATNAVFLWGRRTRMPHRGLQPGRRVSFRNDDIPAIQAVPGIAHLAPRNQLGGYRDGTVTRRGDRTGNYNVMGDVPALAHISTDALVAGRFLNPLDIQGFRKVAVVGSQVVAELYDPGEDPVGTWIEVRGVYFQVVGVLEPDGARDDAERQASMIHVPLSTFQRAFNAGDRIGWLAIAGEPHYSGQQLEDDVRAILMARHDVHPDDELALGSYNTEEEFGRMQRLFTGIRALVWFTGIATLLSGAVGVSNILLIVVRERTREFGLRRALGATPASVVALVMQEALVLTGLAGYSGLVAGSVLCEVAGGFVEGSTLGPPRVDLGVAVLAAVVLTIAGLLAGVLPARHAASIRPVEALRTE